MISFHSEDLTHRLRYLETHPIETLTFPLQTHSKNSRNTGEETHRPAKTLVQIGLSK